MMIGTELQLFHTMLQKLMAALSETIQMYEDYSRIHSPQDNPTDGNFARPPSTWKQEDPAKPPHKFNQSRYEQKMRRERLNKQHQVNGQGVVLPKETLSCKQRIAALRSIGKHVEMEQPKKQDHSKETKKNTAFFVYLQEKRTSFARDYPQLRPQELTKIISDNWKAMSEEERKPYCRENIENRKEFNKNFQKCLSTVLKAQRTDPSVQQQQKPIQQQDQQWENDDSEWKQ